MRIIFCSTLLFFVISTGISFAQSVPTNGLVNAWLFNNSSLSNQIGASNMTAQPSDNDFVTWAKDRFNRDYCALKIDNDSSTNTVYIQIPGIQPEAQDFTYSIWFKPDYQITSDTNNNRIYTIFSFGTINVSPADGAPYLIIRYPDPALRAGLKFTQYYNSQDNYNSISLNSAKNYWENDWYHIAITWDSNSRFLKFYLNGLEIESQTRNNVTASHGQHRPTGLILGANDDGNNGFTGCIDDIRIYNRALIAPEIAELVTEQADGSASHSGLDPRWLGNLSPNDVLNRYGIVKIGSDTLSALGDYKLFVQDGILTEKVMIANFGSSKWPDYVFQKDYPLMPLDKLDNYIEEHGHLPGMPVADEVEEKGLNLGEMNAALLRKIEELTLYMIALNKENQKLRTQNEFLRTKPGRKSIKIKKKARRNLRQD